MGLMVTTIKYFFSLLFDTFKKNIECKTFTEKDIERRERIIQVYIVVLGLLISNNRNPALQNYLMECFMIFLFAALWYYFLLTRFFDLMVRGGFDRADLNIMSLLVAGFFSLFLTIYSLSLSSISLYNNGSLNVVYLLNLLISFLISTMIASAPLFV
jgi:hypothetical protein